MLRSVSLLALFSLSALGSGTSFAASSIAVSSSPLDTYTERTWQMQDGLPEQIVQAFAQTADRYLWIGTTGGLLRFDGERFVLYNRENTPAFHDNNIFCLTISSDNTLWIGTEGGGLIRYRDGVFQALAEKEGLTNAFVRSVHQDAKGQVWVGTDAGLFRLSGAGQLERVDGRNGVPAVAVHAIYEDRAHRLWVGGSRLLSLAGSQVVEYRLPGEGSQNRVKTIVETADGTMWVGTVSGLERMPPTLAAEKSFRPVREVSGTIRFLRETSDGRLWIGTIGHGLQIYSQNRFFRVTAPQRLPSDTVLNLFEDAEKNIWVGTQAGMLRLSESPVSTVTLPDAADSDAETVYQDVDGDVWIAAANLFRSHEGKTTPAHFPGLSGVRIRNVFRDRDGALWIGTEGRGVYRQVGGQMLHYTTQDGLVNNFVRAFLQSRDGSVWIATDEGVSRWTNRHFVGYQMKDGLCYFSTRSILEDRDGDIWIGTDHGVSRLHGDTFVSDRAVQALQNEKVWAIHQDPEGGLWFGTRTGGIYSWRSGRMQHYTVAQGLASNSVYELIEDRNGNFWVSGPNGISVINRNELESAVAPGRRVRVTLYGISEGLEKIQMCGGEKPAGILTREGEAWFPSSKGPVRVSVAQPRPSEPAPVVIDQVMVDGLQIPASAPIRLNSNATKLEVRYGVVLLRSQERMRFRYMLDGFDKDWSEASASRVAYYTNLPPGKYQFRVAAYEMNDPDRIVESSLEIAQQPHFYRTTWFVGSCLLILAALAWSAYQFRLGQVRARFQAVLQERNRLAREMHDTLIQGCVSVSALLEAHSSLGATESDVRHNLLECARTQMRSTIDEARQAIFDLRLTPQSMADIGPLISGMAERISREFDVPVECRTSGKAFSFEQPAVHEVLMVTREAIYNAVRHGAPTKVSVSVDFGDQACIVSVSDDGSGFDPEIVSGLRDGHYGLTGMKERMGRLGARFDVNSQVGSGTELRIEIPRNVMDSHNGTRQIRL